MNYPTCGGGGGPSGGPKEKQLFSAAYTASPYSIDDAMTQIDAAKKNLDIVTTQLDKLCRCCRSRGRRPTGRRR